MIQDTIVRQHKLKNDAAMNAWLERNAIVNHETKRLTVEDNIDHFKVNWVQNFLRILLYSFHNEHVLFESLQTTLQYLKNCYNVKVYLQPSRTSTMELFLRK